MSEGGPASSRSRTPACLVRLVVKANLRHKSTRWVDIAHVKVNKQSTQDGVSNLILREICARSGAGAGQTGGRLVDMLAAETDIRSQVRPIPWVIASAESLRNGS